MNNAKPAHSTHGIPAHSLHGKPVGGQRLSPTATSRPAPSYADYVGRNRCIANGDTCQGFKAKGSDYCAGHLRSRGELNT
jgi:hypothetical protein